MINNQQVISGEGARGAGKTSTFQQIITTLEKPITVNRITTGERSVNITVIDTHKDTSPFHKRALEVHKQWEEEVRIPGESPENLSRKKFELGVLQLRFEADSYAQAIGKSELTLLDRDLDTAVVYSAAEIILSNPDKYETTRSRIHLLSNLWEKVTRVCQTNEWSQDDFPQLSEEMDLLAAIPSLQSLPFRELPQQTFYFFTKDRDESLKRSHTIRRNTSLEYNLSAIQQATQDIVQPIYLYSFLVRKHLFPQSSIHYISSDAHNIAEMAAIVRLHLETDTLEIPGDTEIPLKLRVRKEAPHLPPKDIDKLIDIITESAVGSTFPSKREVRSNSESNCVYNNRALHEYAKLLGLGDIDFVQVQSENYSNSCPIHWVCLQWINKLEGKARIIDLTPFRKEPYISNVVSTKSEGETITVVDKSPGLEFLSFSLDNTDIPERAMEFAYNIEYTFTPEAIEALEKQGYELLGQCINESQKYFVAIRLGRLLLKQNKDTEAIELLELHCSDNAPINLIMAREIAKYVLDGHVTSAHSQLTDYLTQANQVFSTTIENMLEDPLIAYSKISSYYDYRKFIPDALTLLGATNEN